MAATGYLAQKQASPLSFGMVLAIHGAAIAAVFLVKGQEWIRVADKPLEVKNVELLPPPPPGTPPPTQPQQQLVRPPATQIDTPRPLLDTVPSDFVRPPTDSIPVQSQVVGTNPDPVREPVRELIVPPRVEPRPPVMVAAMFDPRFAGRQQPPYPPAMIRAEREGVVSVRVTIAADGRVTAVQKVSASDDAFFEATRRHALSSWRFRPATEDGRPVQSSKVMSIRFELNN